METVVKQTNNGVKIYCIKEEKFKLVNFKIDFKMELNYSEIATYNILLNLLISRNSKFPTINSFNSYLENNYGMSISGNYKNRGNIAFFSLTSSSINSKFSLLEEDLLLKQVETLKDCLYSPNFSKDALEEVKSIYIQRLKEQYNRKGYILKKKVNTYLGTSNPYGVNMESTIEDIGNVTLDDVKKSYEKLLKSECYVYVCGDIEETRIYELMSSFNFTNENKVKLNLNYLKKFDEQITNVYDSNFLQSAISLIYECDIYYGEELFFPLKLFIEMFNYDLFNVIREKYNFCYYIYAVYNNFLNTIEILSEIESKNLNKVIELVDEILKSYTTDFNVERFEICKNKILTYIKSCLDNPKDLIEMQIGFDFTYSISTIEELENAYKNITIEQVKEVSKMISLKVISILKEASNNG